MLLKLNLQRFDDYNEDTPNNPKFIKIKFKDGFNLSTNVDVSTNFEVSGIPYQRIRILNDV